MNRLTQICKTFVRQDLEEKLERNGYVVIPGALHEEEIIEMSTFYTQTVENLSHEKDSFSKSIWDKDLRPKMSELVIRILQCPVSEFFVDHTLVAGHFIAKKPLENSDIKIHHEFSFLDEKVFRPINLWSPLIDVNINSGAMLVLPESHNLSNCFRGYSLPSPYSRIFPDFPVFCKNTAMSQSPEQTKIGKKLLQKFVTIPMKKGDLLVFDSRLLHRTFSNSENVTRIAAAGLVAPTGAQLYNHQGKSDSIVEEYKITKDFYLTWNNFDPPAQRNLIRQFEYDFFTLSTEDEKLFTRLANTNSPKNNWMQKAIRRITKKNSHVI